MCNRDVCKKKKKKEKKIHNALILQRVAQSVARSPGNASAAIIGAEVGARRDSHAGAINAIEH